MANASGNASTEPRATLAPTPTSTSGLSRQLGLKQRQVRTYLRFAHKLPAIEAAMEETDIKISSMEQGLALLSPPKEEVEMSEKEAMVAAVAQKTGRARGALEAVMDSIYDLAPNALSPQEVQLFQQMGDLLTRWGRTGVVERDGTEVTVTSRRSD